MTPKLSKLGSKLKGFWKLNKVCKSKRKSYTEDLLEDQAQMSPLSRMQSSGEVQGESSTRNKDSTSSPTNGPTHGDGSTISQDDSEGSGLGTRLPKIRNPLTGTNAVPGSATFHRPSPGAEGGSTIEQQGSETAVPQHEQPCVEHNEFMSEDPGSAAVQSYFPSDNQPTMQPDLHNTTPKRRRGHRTPRETISDVFRSFGRSSRAPTSTDENGPLAHVGRSQAPQRTASKGADNGTKSQGHPVARTEEVGSGSSRIDFVPFHIAI